VPDDQGNLGVCTRTASAKAIGNGFIEFENKLDSTNKLKMLTFILSLLLAVGVILKFQTDENIELLTNERDSLKSKLDEEVMAQEKNLKKIGELTKNSLNSKLDYEEKHLKKIGELTKERDSLKRILGDELMAQENHLKKIGELTKERDSLKSKLDDELMAKENHLKKNENIKLVTEERDSLKNEREWLRVELTLEKDSTNKLKMLTFILFLLLAVGVTLKLQTDENIKLLTNERDSLKIKLGYEVMAQNHLKKIGEVTKERDILEVKLGYEKRAKENHQKKMAIEYTEDGNQTRDSSCNIQ